MGICLSKKELILPNSIPFHRGFYSLFSSVQVHGSLITKGSFIDVHKKILTGHLFERREYRQSFMTPTLERGDI